MIDANKVPPMDDDGDIPPTIVRDGTRAWVDAPMDSPYAMRLRRFGAHWDPDSARWWVGIAKATALDDLLARPLGDACDEPPQAAQPQSAAAVLVNMALADYTLGVTDTGEPYATHPDKPHVALMLRGGQTGLRAEVASRFWDAYRSPAPQQALAEAFLVLEGFATREEPQRVHLRVAEHDGAVYIDVGDADCHIIEISGGGEWCYNGCAAPVLFRRTKLTGVMPKPIAGGDLSRLWHFVHTAEEDRPLVLAWLVTALIQPDVAHAILALLAEHGCAKSTMTRCLVDLIDPSSVPVRKAPRDAEGWVTAANASWVVALDNLSGTVPLWFSDCLCRASTGDGDVRRALYTDGDVSVISFRRVVVFNGIDVIVTQGDLADRLLRVKLPRITKRIKEAELAAQWADARPQIFGGLLDLAADVHHRLTDLTVEDLPRMADFALVLAAVDEVLGTIGLAHYREQCKRLAADTLDDAFIAELIGRRSDCTAKTSAEILAEIDDATEGGYWDESRYQRHPRGWPRKAREVTAHLTRHAPAMRAQGWHVEDDGGQNKSHSTLWWIYPPTDPEKMRNPGSPTSPTSPNETPPSSGNEEASQASYKYTPPLVLCRLRRRDPRTHDLGAHPRLLRQGDLHQRCQSGKEHKPVKRKQRPRTDATFTI